jgi:hypothetical protein
MSYTDPLAPLQAFRAGLYRCFNRRADALFELTDALLTAAPLLSPAHLSLEPIHRRGWGSLYAALAKGRSDSLALRRLIAAQPLAGGQPVYAVDISIWPRSEAETSPERGYYYHAFRHTRGQPIVAGWAYQWVAQLTFQRDSWTAPVDARRVAPHANRHAVAGEQIRAIQATRPPAAAVPLFVFDAGYEPEPLARELGDLPVAVLVRLRRNRCFYADPTSQRPRGRPRQHGAKFVCQQPATWPAPTAEHTEEDERYGEVHVRAWANLHALNQVHPDRGSHRTRRVVRGWLLLVEVSRLPARTHRPLQLWLWWRGPGTPDLALLWRAYAHRFDLEHTLRFAKQTLHWVLPRVRLPEQADRWTALVVAAYTELRLARASVRDRRLPWERALPPERLTPYRVRRAFSALLPHLGTPASPPKPCGRSPGRPKGRRSGPAPRYPTFKKIA